MGRRAREAAVSKATFKLRRAGIRELLRSQEALRDLERRATAVAGAAGAGHRVVSSIGRNRARAAVIAETPEARRAEALDRNLTRSMNAARD